ncbi:MAG TPA: hypothetical protein VFZ44_08675 [Pyrinomonadaceae bacterium]
MTTNSNIAKRARTTGWPAATLTSARYPGADERRVVCPSASNLNHGGQMIPGGGFQPEGLQRKDRRQLQH